MTIELTDAGRNEYEALVMDAKRYRWLRNEAIAVEYHAPLVFWADDYANARRPLSGLELDEVTDAAIDVAMEAK